MKKTTTSELTVLNAYNILFQKLPVLKGLFWSNPSYGDLDKCIRILLRLVTRELDKPSRSYEQKTKISINLAKIIANFTNLESV